MSSFKKMKLYRFIVCVVLAATALLATGCSEEPMDYREHGYGYVQFKLYKQASYDADNNNREEYLENYARDMRGWGENGEIWYTKS